MAKPKKITDEALYWVKLKSDVPRNGRVLRARDRHQVTGKLLKELLAEVASYEEVG